MDNSEEFDNNIKIIAKSSIVIFIGILLSKLFSYLYRIFIARAYGPESYGLFNLALTITLLFVVFAGLGLDRGLLRYLSFYRGQSKENKGKFILQKSFKISIITGLLAFLILLFSSEFIANLIFKNANLAIYLKIFSLSIPFSILTGLIFSTLRAYEKIEWFSFISNIFTNGTKLLILVILIFLGANQLSVPFSYFIGIFLAFLLAMFSLFTIKSLRSKKEPLVQKEKSKAFSDLFSYSWPLIFFVFVNSIFYSTDSLVIGIFETADQVGIYNAVVPIALLLLLSKDLFSQLFLPIVTKEYAKGDKEVVKQLSKQLAKWTSLMVAPLFVVLFIFPEFFINLLFGKEYVVASTSLRLLLIGVSFVSVFDISKDLLSMKGKSKTIMLDIFLIGAFNLILNLILVPKFGITGAAFSTMLSLIMLNIIFAVQAYIEIKIIPFRRKMITVLVSAGALSIPLFLINYYLALNNYEIIVACIIFGLTYLSLFTLLKGLDVHDRLILNILWKKVKKT